MYQVLIRLKVEHFPKKGTEAYSTWRIKFAQSLRRKNTQKNCTKKIFTTQIITMV